MNRYRDSSPEACEAVAVPSPDFAAKPESIPNLAGPAADRWIGAAPGSVIVCELPG